MITCGICGQCLEPNESCNHLPDIFLNVWNCQYSLARTRNFSDHSKTESLPFEIPESWANWVFDICGGAINRSGQYRIPGMMWEWCIAKMKKDEQAAKFIEKNINEYLANLGD